MSNTRVNEAPVTFTNAVYDTDGTITNDKATPEGVDIVQQPTSISQINPQYLAQIEQSGYQRSAQGASRNVLATTPPAQTGLYTEKDAAGALMQLLLLKNGEPFKASLTSASEAGTAPAVPSQSSASGSTAQAGKTQSADASKNEPAGYSFDQNKVSNTVDNSSFSDDDIKKAQQLRQETSDVQDKSCNKKAYVGEDKRIDQLTKLGVDRDKAPQIARFLDTENVNPGTMHNDQDEQTVALSIVALEKLDKAGNTEAKNVMVSNLNNLADQMTKSTQSKSDGEAYFQTINTLGQYALAASSDAASVSLSNPTLTPSQKLVPYPVISP